MDLLRNPVGLLSYNAFYLVLKAYLIIVLWQALLSVLFRFVAFTFMFLLDEQNVGLQAWGETIRPIQAPH